MPPKFKRNIQCILLRKQEKIFNHTYLRDYHPLRCKPFQANFSLTKKDPNQVQNTTSPHTSQYGIQFVLYRLRSPLLTISHIAFSSSTY